MYPGVPYDLLNPSLLNPSFLTFLELFIPLGLGAYCFTSVYKAKTQKRSVLFWFTISLAVIIVLNSTALFFVPIMARFILHSVLTIEILLFLVMILFVIIRYDEKAKLAHDIENKTKVSKWNNIKKRNLLVHYVLLLLALAFGLRGLLVVQYNLVADLPAAVTGQYSIVTGIAESFHRYTDTPENAKFLITNEAGNNVIYISTNDFLEPTMGKAYKITCLPNSHFVIDILDEAGKSLQK